MPEICRFLGIIITMYYIEWAAMHQSELRENWQLARQNNPLEKIQLLE